MVGIFSLPEDDILSINCLKRVDPDKLWHPNDNFIPKIKKVGAQVYLLDGTKFGCIAGHTNNGLDYMWVGYHVGDDSGGKDKIVPDAYYEFSELMDICPADKFEGLLYYLDVFKSSGKN